MHSYKFFLSITALIVGFAGYAPYLRDVFKGKTKPHVFSWLVWGTLEALAFFAQVAKGGGVGTWTTGASAVIALCIAGIALRSPDKQIRVFDGVALCGALVGIILWRLTSNPLLAVILVSIADAFGFVPTFLKSYHRPDEETAIEYAFSAVKWVFAIASLEAFNLTTWLYPASLILTNSAFVVMVLIRRRQIK